MPITPFHFGPGLAFKALGGDRFSLMAFGVAQVAMDLEPLAGLLSGARVLHGPTHTYLGATVIGFAAAGITARLGRPLVQRWNGELKHCGLSRFAAREKPGRAAIAFGALLGTYSHVVLDSVMHADMKPWAPWSLSNDLLGVLSMEMLHASCGIAAVFGIALWLARQWRIANFVGRKE